jgi:hypothetical protein
MITERLFCVKALEIEKMGFLGHKKAVLAKVVRTALIELG